MNDWTAILVAAAMAALVAWLTGATASQAFVIYMLLQIHLNLRGMRE